MAMGVRLSPSSFAYVATVFRFPQTLKAAQVSSGLRTYSSHCYLAQLGE